MTFDEYRALVETNLEPLLDSLGEIPHDLREAMRYSLMAGGKRLRPVLLLASCEMAGGTAQEALPYACALEMIHTYSLIHDDLPAMDDDDLRRGRPTNHKVFGEDMAILAGDGLLSAAMALMLRDACGRGNLSGTRAAEVIARRAGVTGMVAGQVMDVKGEGTEPTPEKVTYIHAHKTADLLIAPMEAGVKLAGGDEQLLQAAVSYGYHLGLAFQMVDDLLDVEGDVQLLGKETGMDAQRGKLTWIAVHGLEKTREDAAAHVRQAMREANKFGESMNFFKTLAQSTLNRLQ